MAVVPAYGEKMNQKRERGAVRTPGGDQGFLSLELSDWCEDPDGSPCYTELRESGGAFVLQSLYFRAVLGSQQN